MLKRAQSLLLNTALAVALLAGAVAVAAETGLIVTERPPESASRALAGPTAKVIVRGKVRGLYPGAVRTMSVRVRNTFAKQVELRAVRTRTADANSQCSRESIRVKRFRGRVPIPAHSNVRVPVKIRMKPSAPEACQGVKFPLKYTAPVRGQGLRP